MSVRIATRDDREEIFRLLQMLHEENGIYSMDEGAVYEMMDRAFDRKGGIIGVIGGAGDIQGVIFLLISRHWYTRDNHLEELLNFVRPDCRRSAHAKTLIEFAKSCAKEIGIPLVIGVITNKRVVEKVRLYRRSLGWPSGAFFVFNGRWINEQSPDDEFWREPFPPRRANGGKELALKD